MPLIVGNWIIEHEIDPGTGLCTVKVISTKDATLCFQHPPQAIFRDITTRHDCHEQRWRQLHEKIVYRASDIIVAAFPKCGTTWVEHLCLLLQNKADCSQLVGVAHKNTFSPASSSARGKIWPEACIEQDPRAAAQGAEFAPLSWDEFDNAPAPRLLKTHAPPPLLLGMSDNDNPSHITLPVGTKIIVVSRNPLDACVSRFYHAFNPHKLGWSFDAWAALWLSGNTTYGDWFTWVKEWRKQSLEHPNQILWIQYEDLKNSGRVELNRIASFLGFSNSSLLDAVWALGSFEQMKEQARRQGGNGNSNFVRTSLTSMRRSSRDHHGHLRKGITGDWESHFSPEMTELFLSKYRQTLQGTELAYDFGGRLGVIPTPA